MSEGQILELPDPGRSIFLSPPEDPVPLCAWLQDHVGIDPSTVPVAGGVERDGDIVTIRAVRRGANGAFLVQGDGDAVLEVVAVIALQPASEGNQA